MCSPSSVQRITAFSCHCSALSPARGGERGQERSASEVTDREWPHSKVERTKVPAIALSPALDARCPICPHLPAHIPDACGNCSVITAQVACCRPLLRGKAQERVVQCVSAVAKVPQSRLLHPPSVLIHTGQESVCRLHCPLIPSYLLLAQCAHMH